MASSFPLESFVNSVKTLSSQGNLSCLYEFLENSAELLSRQSAHLETALSLLQLEQHSLGVLALLLARFNSAPSSDSAALEAHMDNFVSGCVVDQVRYAPDSYAELCHLYTQRLLDAERPLKGLRVVRQAIAKIQASPHQLTSLHADLCRLSLAAQCFGPALQLLDVDIADISKENGRMDSKALLMYFYYGGMIYAAMKRWERALYCFEVYFAVPAVAVSQIMVEAFKKHILVSLIMRVECPLQRHRYNESARQTVVRRLRPLCAPYLELAAAFASPGPEQLLATVRRHRQVYTRDNNMGLVKQCVESFHKMNIQRLTKTFVTLSLADVSARAQLASPARAEQCLLSMIEDGDIFASISQQDGMVRFHDDPESYASPAMVARLEGELANVMALERRLQEMDDEVRLLPQYVQKCHKTLQDEEPAGTQAACSTSSQNNKAPLANNVM